MSNLTHWKKTKNPDYLGAWALQPGELLTLTIKAIKSEMVTGSDGKKSEETVCYFKENYKPMILNTTNCKAIEKCHNTPYIEDWIGKQIAVESKKVRAFGDVVDALRIRDKLPKQATYTCNDCKKAIADFGEYTSLQIAVNTKKQYGVPLCWDCAVKRKDNVNEADTK